MRNKSVFESAVIAGSTIKVADNEALTGAVVDTFGYEGCMFVVQALKGEALDFSIKVQQDTVVGMGTAADIVGSSVTFNTTVGADGVGVIDIFRPAERYLRPVVTVPNANAATATSVISILYAPVKLPVTQTPDSERHIYPAEGTA